MVDSGKNSVTNDTEETQVPFADTKWRYRANNKNFLYFILLWKILFYYEKLYFNIKLEE